MRSRVLLLVSVLFIALALAGGTGVFLFLPRPPASVRLTLPETQGEEAKPADGKTLYANHCAACHGENGDGKGPAAVFLYPKPRDFGSRAFRLVRTDNRQPADEDLHQVLTRGMPGSSMPPFAHLPESERKRLVEYVRHLMRLGVERLVRAESAETGEAFDPKAVDMLMQVGKPIPLPTTWPKADAASIARGQELYRNACASCHGPTGKGDGAQDQRDDLGIPVRPRDFGQGIFKGGREPAQLYARFVLGMPGSPMPQKPENYTTEQIGDAINFVLSLSEPGAAAPYEHHRTQIQAQRSDLPLPDEISDRAWGTAKVSSVVVTPLWWREFTPPRLQVQALHDGTTLALRLSWLDAKANRNVARPEDFEDMAAVQLFQGKTEPFLGMGAETGKVDLWLWRASWGHPQNATDFPLDDYPFDTPLYRELTRKQGKPAPDFLTARAAGNPHAHADPSASASSLTAKGFGSTTFLPKPSQVVAAQSAWKDGRWTVVMRRPLQVDTVAGLPLTAKQRYSIAFALWDGEARDRNGQKLTSIWHDLTLE